MVRLVQWLVFAIPLPRRGAVAYIVGVVDHPYLATRLPLWLTLSSYASTTPVVLAVRDASTGRPYDRWGFGFTSARSTARPLAPPYLRPTSLSCWVGHVGGPIVRRSDDVAARSLCAISFSPPREDLLEVLDEGAEDEVLYLARELGNWNDARADPTECELGNLNSAGADPIEQELGNLMSQDLIRPSRSSGIVMSQELIQPSRSLGIVMSQDLIRPSRGSGIGMAFAKGELGHKSWDLAERVNSGANLRIRPKR
ncbi:hypothetical protein B296_00041198 [Ensete ventricosum]|uniref:Uncharacterized protein n=1 Tax=Ensete ventricosum TaxID=4639 RepID=A0A426Z692_ENSVE|nr:hypothetical protein B296_00041198 [Ensete ventricosum]